MKNTIYTIPINEAFEKKCGCPICSMQDNMENRVVNFITGGAMMEPDIRQQTNKIGFCCKHFDIMQREHKRLEIALMLETHTKSMLKSKNFRKTALEVEEECFVCKMIKNSIKRHISMLYFLYDKEADFRKLFAQQPMFCLKHYNLLINGADKKISKKHYSEFVETLESITLKHLKDLNENLTAFCKNFDYNFKGSQKIINDSKKSIEKTIEFLVGH